MSLGDDTACNSAKNLNSTCTGGAISIAQCWAELNPKIMSAINISYDTLNGFCGSDIPYEIDNK